MGDEQPKRLEQQQDHQGHKSPAQETTVRNNNSSLLNQSPMIGASVAVVAAAGGAGEAPQFSKRPGSSVGTSDSVESGIVAHLRSNGGSKYMPQDVVDRETTVHQPNAGISSTAVGSSASSNSAGGTTLSVVENVFALPSVLAPAAVAGNVSNASCTDGGSTNVGGPTPKGTKLSGPGCGGSNGAIVTRPSSSSPAAAKVKAAATSDLSSSSTAMNPLAMILLQQQLSRNIALAQLVRSTSGGGSTGASSATSVGQATAFSQSRLGMLGIGGMMNNNMGILAILQQQHLLPNQFIDPLAFALMGDQRTGTYLPGSPVRAPSARDAAGAPVNKKSRSPIILYMDCDEDSLSEYQCILRKQIELFEADAVDASSSVQGRNKQIVHGQVGIRCRHCSHKPISKRQKGSIYFPTKLDRIYQAAQNLSAFHLAENCEHCPGEVRQKILLLRERKSPAGGGKHYWAEGVRCLGVTEDQNGLRFP